MKRNISLIILMVILLSVFSCGSSNQVPESETVDSNTIEITMDNYSKYLKISAVNIENYGLSNEVIDYRDSSRDIFYGYEQILFSVEIEGVSPNFIYNDIKLTMNFSSEYGAFNYYILDNSDVCVGEHDFDIVVDGNVAGGGYETYIFDVFDICGFPYTNRNYFKSNSKVVNVTGSVTQVKQ